MNYNETKKKLTLARTESKFDYTCGKILELENVFTVELGWKDNENRVSCIPTGKYVIRKWNSPKFGQCLKVFDADGKSEVKGRDQILIHAGNTTADTKGCILPCEAIQKNNGVYPFGFFSKTALRKIENFVGNEDVGLEVKR